MYIEGGCAVKSIRTIRKYLKQLVLKILICKSKLDRVYRTDHGKIYIEDRCTWYKIDARFNTLYDTL